MTWSYICPSFQHFFGRLSIFWLFSEKGWVFCFQILWWGKVLQFLGGWGGFKKWLMFFYFVKLPLVLTCDPSRKIPHLISLQILKIKTIHNSVLPKNGEISKKGITLFQNKIKNVFYGCCRCLQQASWWPSLLRKILFSRKREIKSQEKFFCSFFLILVW